MVEVVASNTKLRTRRLRMLIEATGAPPERCAEVLVEAADEVKVAIVAILAGCSADQARLTLGDTDGAVDVALAALEFGR
jgi:N-acetylmuramic acid 6-phosphate etherase